MQLLCRLFKRTRITTYLPRINFCEGQPSLENEFGYDRIQIDSLPAVTEGVVSIHVNMLPGNRRHQLDQRQDLCIRACVVFPK